MTAPKTMMSPMMVDTIQPVVTANLEETEARDGGPEICPADHRIRDLPGFALMIRRIGFVRSLEQGGSNDLVRHR